MTAKYPRFVPILGNYITRVSGRALPELLASPAGLARALADMQHVVGHDGVLCFYAPYLLAKCCLKSPSLLRTAEDVPRSGSMAAVLEAIGALRTALLTEVRIVACIPGPALMLAELRRSCSGNPPELSDTDYVDDAFLGLVRAACEAGAHGIAVAENASAVESVSESSFRSARKLVDFYHAALFVFLEPGSDTASAFTAADVVFKLPSGPEKLELLVGAANGSVQNKPTMTTNMDVPVDVSVEELRALRALAMQ